MCLVLMITSLRLHKLGDNDPQYTFSHRRDYLMLHVFSVPGWMSQTEKRNCLSNDQKEDNRKYAQHHKMAFFTNAKRKEAYKKIIAMVLRLCYRIILLHPQTNNWLHIHWVVGSSCSNINVKKNYGHIW